jgi:hypothetical protein
MLRSRTATQDDAESNDELDDSDDDEDNPVLPDSCLSFLENHPLKHTHCLKKLKHEKVATIKYKRLPDRHRIGKDTVEPTILQERADYAQIALICGTAWRTLADLLGDEASAAALAHAEEAKEGDAPSDVYWTVFKERFAAGDFTARGQQFIDCAQEWFDSPVEDIDDVLGSHGPVNERVLFDKGDIADEPLDVNWEEFAKLCAEFGAGPSSSSLSSVTSAVMPMQIVAPMMGMPDQKVLDAFMDKHFPDGSSGRKPKEPFALVCPGSSVAADNELPLPDPNSRGLDISTAVRDLAEVVTHIDVDVAAEGKYEAKTIRLPSRPSLQVVALAFALNRQQFEAFACIACTFLRDLLAKYPHDADTKAAATDALSEPLITVCNREQLRLVAWPRWIRQVSSGICSAGFRESLGVQRGHHYLCAKWSRGRADRWVHYSKAARHRH